jgi:pimeloyl-ACP methyl ester carboxylesterase
MRNEMQNALPQAQTRWIDAGHMFPETQPAETARLTLAFFS